MRYMMAEVMRGRRRTAHLFELEDDEDLEDVAKKNLGENAVIVKSRVPTPEEYILLQRGMLS